MHSVHARDFLTEQPGMEIERSHDLVVERELTTEVRPSRRGEEIGERPLTVVDPGRDNVGTRRHMREQRRRRGADRAVGDGEQRLMPAPGIAIELIDDAENLGSNVTILDG